MSFVKLKKKKNKEKQKGFRIIFINFYSSIFLFVWLTWLTFRILD